MGPEENTSNRQTQRRTNTRNSEPYDHKNTNHKGEMPMIKHPYQTCLRMPLSLKEDMIFYKTLLIPFTESFSIHLKKGSKKVLSLCCKSAM